MKNSTELKQERAAFMESLDLVIKKVEAESRDFSDDEQREFDDLSEKIDAHDEVIKRAEKVEAQKRRIEEMKMKNDRRANKPTTDENKVQQRYSITRAIFKAARGQRLDGVEAEMQQEAEREAETNNQVIAGIGVPSMLFGKRALVAGTAATAGDTIQTDLGELIPFLRPNLVVEQLGAQMLTDLQGDLEMPRKTGETTANWAGEVATATETTPTFEKFKLSPKRLAAFTEYSLQLLRQSSLSVENMVREDLAFAVRKAVDYAAIHGSGSSNQPAGLLSFGIGSVAVGANGGALTRDHLVDLGTTVDTSDALMGNLAYYTTPGVKGSLMKTKTDAGSGAFLWPEGASGLLGYNAATSTQLRTDLTKGTGTGLHPLIFGNWRELIVASWLGLDIVVNPYSKDKEGIIRTTVNSFWDVNLRHAASFAAIVDADVS